MTKYLKHYWKKNGNWLTTANEVEQHHPEADYPGLDVNVWMHDSDGVDLRTAEEGGDTDTAATKNTAAAAKETEAQNALNAL